MRSRPLCRAHPPSAPMYHTWGVLNPDYPAFQPSEFPLGLETRFDKQGIHLLFNPQRLRPEWFDTICFSGICDIVFRSTGDLVKYQELLPSAKPFLLSKISGQRANVSGQSIILKKALGPSACTCTMCCTLPPPPSKPFSPNVIYSGKGMTPWGRDPASPTTSASKLMRSVSRPPSC